VTEQVEAAAVELLQLEKKKKLMQSRWHRATGT